MGHTFEQPLDIAMDESLLKGAKLLGIAYNRPKKLEVEVAIGLKSDWRGKFPSGQPAILELSHKRCTLKFVNSMLRMETGAFLKDFPTPKAETRIVEAASFRLDVTRKSYAEILATDGQTLLDLAIETMKFRESTFKNGSQKIVSDTVKALANYLHARVFAASQTPALGRTFSTLLIDRTGARRDAEPGFLSAINRWFGWSGTGVAESKYSSDCKFSRFFSSHEWPDLGQPCAEDDEERLNAIWVAMAGEQDPRHSLTDDSPYHDHIEAERQYRDVLLPKAHGIRDEVARYSKTSPERLEMSAKVLAKRINVERLRLYS